jgi:drug/metabolite transporter (DMT)-like permease
MRFDNQATAGSTSVWAIVMLGVMNIIWGMQFPFTKPALEVMPPFTFTLFRFSLAMVVILPLAGIRCIKLLTGTDGVRLATIGLMGFCIAQVSQTLALDLSLASDISLLATSTPLWMAVLARLWLKETLNNRKRIGFVFAIAGLLIILWPQNSGSPVSQQRILGDAIFMITGFSWAYYNVRGKEIMEKYSPLETTAVAGLVGTIAIVPFAAFEWINGMTPKITLLAAASVAYAGLLATAFGFVVLFWALARVPAAHAAIMMYLQPVSGVLVACFLLDEPVGMRFLLGGAAVFLGVALVTFKSTKRTVPLSSVPVTAGEK